MAQGSISTKDLNPNLVVILHYLSKVLWLALAAYFGRLGTDLYMLGITQTGGATINIFGAGVKLTNAGPGLVVMVVALVCALIGAWRAKLVFGNDQITIAAPTKTHSTAPLLLDDMTARAFAEATAAAFLNMSGTPIAASESYSWLDRELRKQIAQKASTCFSPEEVPGAKKRFSVEWDSCIYESTATLATDKKGLLVTVQPEREAKQREFISRKTLPLAPNVPHQEAGS